MRTWRSSKGLIMPFSRACRLIQRSLLITDTPCSDRTACRGRVKSREAVPTSRRSRRPAGRAPARRSRRRGGPAPWPGDASPPAAAPREHGGPRSAQDAAERAGRAAGGGHRVHPREEPEAIGLVEPVLHRQREQIHAARARAASRRLTRCTLKMRQPARPPWAATARASRVGSRSWGRGRPTRSRAAPTQLTAVTRGPCTQDSVRLRRIAAAASAQVTCLLAGGGGEQRVPVERLAHDASWPRPARRPTRPRSTHRPPVSGMRLTQRGARRESEPDDLEGQRGPARGDVLGALVEPVPLLALHRDRDPVGLLERDLVVERQRQAQRVESGTEVG